MFTISAVQTLQSPHEHERDKVRVFYFIGSSKISQTIKETLIARVRDLFTRTLHRQGQKGNKKFYNSLKEHLNRKKNTRTKGKKGKKEHHCDSNL
jgi:hypothetical protein